ncbi:hypothetical protein D7Y09_12760 [bacterium 1XD42-1]|nr:hypothetical protein D7Y09_12760 [bacterium 1XD42-1]
MTISEGVTTIEDGVFDECSSLTSITIPESVTIIGSFKYNIFEGCPNLTIYAPAGSNAETYAKKRKIPFIPTRKNENRF